MRPDQLRKALLNLPAGELRGLACCDIASTHVDRTRLQRRAEDLESAMPLTNFRILRLKRAFPCRRFELQVIRAERCLAGFSPVFCTYWILQAWIASGVKMVNGTSSIPCR